MTVDLLTVGKTDSAEVAALVDMYMKRMNRYVKFSVISIPDVRGTRNMDPATVKKLEGEQILKQFAQGDYVVLLDEKGTEYRSVAFAQWLEKRMASGIKRIVFVVGGAYGFSHQIYDRADSAVSLSKMTFSHQIIRAIFAEQLYRAFSILNNEPYHNE